MTRKEHWNQVYETKGPEDLSWYQRRPELSLELIEAAQSPKDAGIIDVGGGISTLIDSLMAMGYNSLGVLDVSGAALTRIRSRLGDKAKMIEWFEADVTSFTPPH